MGAPFNISHAILGVFIVPGKALHHFSLLHGQLGSRLIASNSFWGGNSMPELVRRPHIMAGLFYPETAADARRAIEHFMGPLAAAGPDTGVTAPSSAQTAALIVPHAAWELSGQAVGAAVACARQRDPQRVIVIGPTHQGSANGIYLTESESFETVLGDIEVDGDFNGELESCGTNFVFNDIPHLEEHSIEIVLPFLKYSFPKARLVPILLSGARPADVSALARALDFLVGPDPQASLIVVSANLARRGCSCGASLEESELEDLVTSRDAPGLLALSGGKPPLCGAAVCASLFLTRMSHDWHIAIAAREEARLDAVEDREGEVSSCYRSFACRTGV